MLLKLAFGTITTDVVYNGNFTTREFIRIAKNTISSVFTIDDATIEIVLSHGEPNSELGEKLPETDVIMAYYIGNRNIDVFYARVTLHIGNDEYIKTNNDQGIIYFKKSDINNLEIQTFSEDQVRQMPVMIPTDLVPDEPETCSICYERQICHARRYSCIHLFCGICPNQWPLSCAICRSR